MWGKKTKNSTSDVRNLRRSRRVAIQGEVLIQRPGKPTLRTSIGNISEGGMFLELSGQHDLQKGKRVQIVFVHEDGPLRELNRMTGIVLRVEKDGVALVTYQSSQLKQ